MSLELSQQVRDPTVPDQHQMNEDDERVHMVLVWCCGVPNLLREHQLRFRLISTKGQLIIDL